MLCWDDGNLEEKKYIFIGEYTLRRKKIEKKFSVKKEGRKALGQFWGLLIPH